MPAQIGARFYAIIILIICLVIAVFAIAFDSNWVIVKEEQIYQKVDVNFVQHLYNVNAGLIVVDTSADRDTYINGHLPKATWSTNPEHFYAAANDILVYGDNAKSYCERLLGHTSGDIYYYNGSYENWINRG